MVHQLVTELVSIERVDAVPVKGGLTQYLIEAQRVEPPIYGQQLQTVSNWRASVCERAWKTKQLARVTWQWTSFGLTLRKVTLEPRREAI